MVRRGIRIIGVKARSNPCRILSSCHVMSYHNIFYTISHQSHFITSHHIIAYHAMVCHTSYHNISHTISCQSISPHHIISYHTTNIISYLINSQKVFSKTFSSIKMFNFDWNSIDIRCYGYNWQWFSMGSGNSLVPSGSKPLPEPMLSKIYDVICQQATTSQYSQSRDVWSIVYSKLQMQTLSRN